MKLIGSWERKAMFRTTVVNSVVAAAALGLAAASAQAQSTVKVGALLPMTGQQQSTGVQIAAAIRLYMAQNGSQNFAGNCPIWVTRSKFNKRGDNSQAA